MESGGAIVPSPHTKQDCHVVPPKSAVRTPPLESRTSVRHAWGATRRTFRPPLILVDGLGELPPLLFEALPCDGPWFRDGGDRAVDAAACSTTNAASHGHEPSSQGGSQQDRCSGAVMIRRRTPERTRPHEVPRRRVEVWCQFRGGQVGGSGRRASGRVEARAGVAVVLAAIHV